MYAVESVPCPLWTTADSSRFPDSLHGPTHQGGRPRHPRRAAGRGRARVSSARRLAHLAGRHRAGRGGDAGRAVLALQGQGGVVQRHDGPRRAAAGRRAGGPAGARRRPLAGVVPASARGAASDRARRADAARAAHRHAEGRARRGTGPGDRPPHPDAPPEHRARAPGVRARGRAAPARAAGTGGATGAWLLRHGARADLQLAAGRGVRPGSHRRGVGAGVSARHRAGAGAGV